MRTFRTILAVVALPVVLTIAMYIVFYSKITCNPGDAGFWLIIAMGMSVGAALTRFIQLSREKTNNE
jgi:hypothetical protein